jgi:hypothetical protein
MFKCKNCSQTFGSYLEWSSHFMVHYLKRSGCSKEVEPEVILEPMGTKKILDSFTELFQTNMGIENYKLTKENELLRKELELLRKQSNTLNDELFKSKICPSDGIIIDILKDEIKVLQKKNEELSNIKNYLISIDSVRYKKIEKNTILISWIDKLLNGEDLSVEELERFDNIKENNELAEEIGIEIDPDIKDMDLEELTKQMGLISD